MRKIKVQITITTEDEEQNDTVLFSIVNDMTMPAEEVDEFVGEVREVFNIP